MELSTVLKWLFIAIKWIFILAAFLFAIILAGISLLSGVTAHNEKKAYAGKDYGWKFFLFIAIVAGTLSCVFGFLGYLLI